MVNAVECGLLMSSFVTPVAVTFEIVTAFARPSGFVAWCTCLAFSCVVGLAGSIFGTKAYLWAWDRHAVQDVTDRRESDGWSGARRGR